MLRKALYQVLVYALKRHRFDTCEMLTRRRRIVLRKPRGHFQYIGKRIEVFFKRAIDSVAGLIRVQAYSTLFNAVTSQ